MARDEFTEKTKQILAERVGWRCSYPGCVLATIGPHTDDNKSTCLGEAAHITAAMPGGPRFDANLTAEGRRNISNGIWMCKPHARLIDVDKDNFSSATLRQWKILAERKAYEALEQGPVPGSLAEPQTLIAFGLRTVVKGVWLSGGGDIWRFKCSNFFIGNSVQLRDDIEHKKIEFIVVESQGDGRLVRGPIQWQSLGENLEVVIPVEERAEKRDPKTLGSDLALGLDGDLFVKNGGIARVSGVENAIQRISTSLGTMLGELFMHPKRGSMAALYYHRFATDLKILERLFKLEIARLATISLDGQPPSLNTIWRVNGVRIPTADLVDRRLAIEVDLEWATGEKWVGVVRVFIHENLDKFPSWAGIQ